jgi:hypothetical protein
MPNWCKSYNKWNIYSNLKWIFSRISKIITKTWWNRYLKQIINRSGFKANSYHIISYWDWRCFFFLNLFLKIYIILKVKIWSFCYISMDYWGTKIVIIRHHKKNNKYWRWNSKKLRCNWRLLKLIELIFDSFSITT